ncbi:MAG: ATP-binding cassette domain-containing protein [Alphaproteobacteria bacterium]|nr:ATP-binding cassette domain-containing protein [Alphaproteobacteria bacterium]
MAVLELFDVHKDFGGLAAVAGVSLRLEAGSMLALVGPNGCGKSTLFDLVCGAQRPTRGRIAFAGQDITAARPEAIARLGIGRKFQTPTVFDALTAGENMAVARLARERPGFWVRAGPADDTVLAQVGLAGRQNVRAGALAHGERQWLELGLLLASGAELLLLDEPTAGMTAAETAATAALVRGLPALGRSAFVIEHDMAFVRALGCPVAVMAAGRILRFGSYATVEADPEVRALYFGAQVA